MCGLLLSLRSGFHSSLLCWGPWSWRHRRTGQTPLKLADSRPAKVHSSLYSGSFHGHSPWISETVRSNHYGGNCRGLTSKTGAWTRAWNSCKGPLYAQPTWRPSRFFIIFLDACRCLWSQEGMQRDAAADCRWRIAPIQADQVPGATAQGQGQLDVPFSWN